MILAFQVPNIMTDIATLLTIASAEGTARDLAGLITISGAAQDMATIIYEGETPTVSYDITIKDRMVTITGIRKDSEQVMKANTPIKTGWGKLAIDPFGEFTDVRIFTVKKTRLCTITTSATSVCCCDPGSTCKKNCYIEESSKICFGLGGVTCPYSACVPVCDVYDVSAY
jgi:hypothetical protein